MKTKKTLNQLRKQFERLRKDSLKAVGTSNESVYAGLQNFADKELRSLAEYYERALSSLRSAQHNGLKTVVQTQIDLMQSAFTRLVAHARESVESIAAVKPREASAPAKAAATPAAARPAAAKKSATRKAPVKAAKKAANKAEKAVKVPKTAKPATKKAAPKSAAKAAKAAAPAKKAAAKKAPRKAKPAPASALATAPVDPVASFEPTPPQT